MTNATMRHGQDRAAVERDAALFIRKQFVALAILAILLFASAGTFNWPMGWVQLILQSIVVAVYALFFRRHSPDLLAERSRLQPGTKAWDRPLVLFASGLLPLASWVIAGLDFRFGWSGPIPVGLFWLGLVGWLAGYGLVVWSMWENRFFSATVRIQSERGHTVMTGGPYRIVRHPGYVGAMLFQLATGFVLGSYWAVLPNFVAAVLYVVRTAREDATLQAELPGYQAFTHKTRYRLLPGVW